MAQFLKVPGEWLKACGLGDKDKLLPVTSVRSYGPGRTFVKVLLDGRPWEVWAEERGATLLDPRGEWDY